MNISQLTTLSPLDGRYGEKLQNLRPIFSELGLMKMRLLIEIRWLQMLSKLDGVKECPPLSDEANQLLEECFTQFSEEEALRVKEIENQTNHDVKAIEYFLKERFRDHEELNKISEFIHFACTSEDINNLAYSLMLKTARDECLLPALLSLLNQIIEMAHQFADVPLLARTHGQPASPTTMGKEFANVAARLQRQITTFLSQPILGKCNGAVGNYNAHVAAYPEIDWEEVSERFLMLLELDWNDYTTQIEPHDTIAEYCHTMERMNTILIDFSRDIWNYISLNYFQQIPNKQEVGSSTMPHKINPIDFENAEGNLGLSNALLSHFASKLPISRGQRDLSDSTVLRNLGTGLAHASLAVQSIAKGLKRLLINEEKMRKDLRQHWEVLAEAVQTVMRRYGIEEPYEKLKAFTRGKVIDKTNLHAFIDSLVLPDSEKKRLKKLTPETYLGKAIDLAKKITLEIELGLDEE